MTKEVLVHLSAANLQTKKHGNYGSPLEQVSTACSQRWSTRPQRTRLVTLVTCPVCLRCIEAHPVPEGQLAP